MREAIDRFRQREYRKHPRRPRNVIRYPPALRRRVVAFIRKRESEGKSLRHISGELGLGQQTLRDWMARRREPRLRAVEVAGPAAVTPPKTLVRALVLVTPRGYRVEGLDRESLTELLRVLG
jgi:transposase-like protein